jgi:hypothetical protein
VDFLPVSPFVAVLTSLSCHGCSFIVFTFLPQIHLSMLWTKKYNYKEKYRISTIQLPELTILRLFDVVCNGFSVKKTLA